MKGEFRGDFSRDTFDPRMNFLRVLMQQGRVSLDADWNEQVDILLHYMQTLAKDTIGPFAGPDGKDLGFGIIPSTEDKSFNIGYGRYYVDGILCENEKKDVSCGMLEVADLGFYGQPYYPIANDPSIKDFLLNEDDLPLLVYLDVWERHISYIEDDDIREKALGGPDTASRSKIIWQVKVLKKLDGWEQIIQLLDGETRCEGIRRLWPNVVEKELQWAHRGCLKAQAKKPTEDATDPCITSPEARYRGEENQLYRVEIHNGGEALIYENGKKKNESTASTFKWSRDNSTVAFPLVSKNGLEVFLEHLGRDDRLSLKVGDWVELIDDDYTLLILSRPSPRATRSLAQVDKIDLTEMKVTLKSNPDLDILEYSSESTNHPLLRRWDHNSGYLSEKEEPQLADQGALFVEEGKWLNLEDGVQVFFEANPAAKYCTGDYWLIPLRTASGDVEWPYTIGQGQKKIKIPRALAPHGMNHHYAPLAVLTQWNDNGINDCRCVISTTCNPPLDSATTKKERSSNRGKS